MKKTFLKSIIVTAATLSVAGALSSCGRTGEYYEGSNTSADVNAGMNLLINFQSHKAYDLYGSFTATYGSYTFGLDLVDGNCQLLIPSIQNPGARGDLILDVDGTQLEANASYFNDIVTLDILNNHFKAKSKTLEDLSAMLNTGIRNSNAGNIGYNPIVLEKIAKNTAGIDWVALASKISKITGDQKAQDQDGEWYYPLNYEGIDIEILTKANMDVVLGLKLNNVDIEGVNVYGAVMADPILEDEVTIVNPLEQEDADKYIDFKDSFNLINGVMDIVDSQQVSGDLKATLYEKSGNELKNRVDIDLDADFDYGSMSLYVDGNLGYNDHSFSIFGAYEDETVYASLNELDVKFTTESIFGLIEYFESKNSTNALKPVLNTLNVITAKSDLAKLVEQIKNGLGKIELTDKKLKVTFDASQFDRKLSSLDIELTFNSNGLDTLTIPQVSYDSYVIQNLSLKFGKYTKPSFEKSKFMDIEPAFGLVEAVENLSTLEKFRLIIDAKIGEADSDLVYADVDADFNVDLPNKLGFGEANILDNTGKNHNIKADVDTKGEIVFAYNDKLKGYLDTAIFNEVLDETAAEGPKLIKPAKNDNPSKDAVDTSDLINTLRNLLDGISSPIIEEILGGNYFAILELDLISDLVVTENMISFDLNVSEILNVGVDEMHLSISWTKDGNGKTILDTLSISKVTFDTFTLELSVKLREYSQEIEAARLVKDDSFIDFSSIKTLIEFGINTTEFEYYYISGQISIDVDISVISTTINLPFDLKIRRIDNDKGINVALEFTDIPVYEVLNRNSGSDKAIDFDKNRTGSAYYDGEDLYVSHVDRYTFGRTKRYYKRCDEQYVSHNLMYILCADLLYINSDRLNDLGVKEDTSYMAKAAYQKVSGNDVLDTLGKINFEDVIIDYNYETNVSLTTKDVNNNDKTSICDIFDFVLDLGEIIQDDNFSNLNLRIGANTETKVAEAIYASTSYVSGVISTDISVIAYFRDLGETFEGHMVELAQDKGVSEILITDSNHPFYEYNRYIYGWDKGDGTYDSNYPPHNNDTYNVTTSNY